MDDDMSFSDKCGALKKLHNFVQSFAFLCEKVSHFDICMYVCMIYSVCIHMRVQCTHIEPSNTHIYKAMADYGAAIWGLALNSLSG